MGRGSPLLTTRARPWTSPQRSSAATSASTAFVTYVLSTSDAPEPTTGRPPRRARSTMRATSWVSPGPPDQMRADRRAPPAHRSSAARASLLGERLAPGVRPAGAARIGRVGAGPHQRGAGVRDRRGRDVHQPAYALRPARLDHGPGADHVGPLVLRPRAGDVDLRGQVDDGLVSGDGGPYGGPDRRRRRAPPAGRGRPVAAAAPSPRHRAPPGRARRRPRACRWPRSPAPSRATHPAAAQHPLGPAGRAVAGPPSRRAGCPPAAPSRRAPRRPARRRPTGPRPPGRVRPAVPRARLLRHHDHDKLLGAGRADADGRRGPDAGHGLDPLLDADRGERSGRSGDHVDEPSLDPQPARRVEVPDVAGAVPAGIRVSSAARWPTAGRSAP